MKLENSIGSMDSAYESGNMEEILNGIDSNIRKENENLIAELENEKKANASLQRLNKEENENLREQLENEKEENANLKKSIKYLKEKKDTYLIGKVVLKEENKKMKEKISELMKEKEINPEFLKEHELLQTRYSELQNEMTRKLEKWLKKVKEMY